ncbi:hypothetical protein BDN71DRAFT_764969 [Pleurotus eryngii]|uniref:Uncharacterized protein n=1 Tax=Pleurotus eryngii TaxID=5323 RepID=A0A9P5ZXY8_PLEER|nr:hypothetical protein BDN71DRAFT_764969 [Pleurotus eryngii]
MTKPLSICSTFSPPAIRLDPCLFWAYKRFCVHSAHDTGHKKRIVSSSTFFLRGSARIQRTSGEWSALPKGKLFTKDLCLMYHLHMLQRCSGLVQVSESSTYSRFPPESRCFCHINCGILVGVSPIFGSNGRATDVPAIVLLDHLAHAATRNNSGKAFNSIQSPTSPALMSRCILAPIVRCCPLLRLEPPNGSKVAPEKRTPCAKSPM